MGSIRIFITGGTFDKEYDEIAGQLYFKTTHLSEILELGRSKVATKIETLMMKDSLELEDHDRALILKKCQSCPEKKIVITHGTDTMAKTAAVLGAAKMEKTIILTGALIPYKFGSSDGFFNLGSALAFAQTLASGVYIAMNGKYFSWDNVRKNVDLGIFEELR